MKLIAQGQRKKKAVLKEAIKAAKEIFRKVLEEEFVLKDTLMEKMEEC